MPSIVTHHYFAKEVLKNLPEKISKKIDLSTYLIFAQSFDNLFYYKFLTPWQGKKIRKLGHTAQKEKINAYFKNILTYIKSNHLEKNTEVLSYLYGSICHYVLDYHCHPFIIYLTGRPEINLKYRGMHEQMEVNIDAYYYNQKTKKELKKENLADQLLPKIHFSKELKNTIDYTFFTTFNEQNMGNIFEKSFHTGNFLLKYFVTDSTGIKKQIYKIKDFVSPTSKRKYQYLSFHVSKINMDYLNLKKESWFYPADPSIQKNNSFAELYEASCKDAVEKILAIQKYLNDEISEKKVLQIIGDNSYETGLSEQLHKTSKYFKY